MYCNGQTAIRHQVKANDMRPESKGVLTDIQAGWTVTYCPLPIYIFLIRTLEIWVISIIRSEQQSEQYRVRRFEIQMTLIV